jgi:hypothetical protein
MSRFHHMQCLLCNERIEGGVSRGWAFSVHSGERQIPPGLMIHESCAKRAAHPDFDWNAVEAARKEMQAIFDQAPPAL